MNGAAVATEPEVVADASEELFFFVLLHLKRSL
jgi:hypothetical protein